MWEQIQQALSQSTTRMLSGIAALLPGIGALILAVLISLALAKLVAGILRRALERLHFDGRVHDWGYPSVVDWSSGKSPTIVVVRVVFWTDFGCPHCRHALPILERLVEKRAPKVRARFASRSVLIEAVNMNLQYARLLSVGVRWMIMVLAVAMALEQLAIGGGIIRLAFGILFGGIVLALALAVGLGSKELVSRSLEREAHRAAEQSEEPVRHL